MDPIAASAILVGLLLLADGSSAVAVEPPAVHSKSLKSKSSEDQKKPSAASNRHKPPAADLDSREADDTLESALENYQTMLAVIANNIANVDTPGFKRSRVIVEDLGYRQNGLPGVEDSSGEKVSQRIFYRIGQPDRGHGDRLPAGEIEADGSRTGSCHRGPRFLPGQRSLGRGLLQPRRALFAEAPAVRSSSSRPKPAACWSPRLLLPTNATSISISPQGVVSYRTDSSPPAGGHDPDGLVHHPARPIEDRRKSL